MVNLTWEPTRVCVHKDKICPVSLYSTFWFVLFFRDLHKNKDPGSLFLVQYCSKGDTVTELQVRELSEDKNTAEKMEQTHSHHPTEQQHFDAQ